MTNYRFQRQDHLLFHDHGRAVHVGHFRAMSPSTDPLIYMDTRENRHQSRRLTGGRVCDASRTAFLTHSSERHENPREEQIGASPAL